jgi:hypothetical protein
MPTLALPIGPGKLGAAALAIAELCKPGASGARHVVSRLWYRRPGHTGERNGQAQRRCRPYHRAAARVLVTMFVIVIVHA